MELVVASYIADLIFGDPQWFPHPVRGIGKLIFFFDKRLRRGLDRNIERILGALTVLVVAGISGIFAYLFIALAESTHPLLGKISWAFLGYTTLATRDLIVHGRAVWKEVVKDNIEGARNKLSFMVGRDTHFLPKEKIITATVESVAESINDGIIAPLFYLFIGGPVLAIIYKTVNTLDSMIGHNDEEYRDFGWFSAKADDIFNFIPARISGLLIVAAAFLSGKDAKSSFRIMLRDKNKHASPNSAVSEAAVAGALGIRLGGPSSYQGEKHERPYIGDIKREINERLITEAVKISMISSLLMVGIGALVKR